MSNGSPDDRKHWLDDRKKVDRIWYGLLVLCALLFGADALYHKHAHFSAENWFGFCALFGLLACVALVAVARLLRAVVTRPEDYYDKADD